MPNCPWCDARPAPRSRIRRGPHLLVLARGPEGYRRLSRQIAAAHLAGGEKGKLRYDFDALTEAAGGHWQILTGCRKGHVRQALSDGRPGRSRGGAAPIWSTGSAPTGSASSSPTTAIPLDDERNAALADARAAVRLPVVATTAAHFAEPSGGRLAMAMGAIRARQLDGRGGRLPGADGRCAPAVRGGDGAAVRHRHPSAVTAAADLGESARSTWR